MPSAPCRIYGTAQGRLNHHHAIGPKCQPLIGIALIKGDFLKLFFDIGAIGGIKLGIAGQPGPHQEPAIIARLYRGELVGEMLALGLRPSA